MGSGDRLREILNAAISGIPRGRPVADRLCAACVGLLDADGVALSLVNDGAITRALGSSGAASQGLNDLEFTLGEGPCLQVAASFAPVMAGDLYGRDAERWPAFAEEAAKLGVRAVFALPVAVAGFAMGTLLFYRTRPGRWEGGALEGCFLAAELAAMPILDVMGTDLEVAINDDTSTAWDDMAALARSEVYQAAGMLIAQLEISPAEALVRLRSYAFAQSRTTSQVAYDILERNLRLSDDGPGHGPRPGRKF